MNKTVQNDYGRVDAETKGWDLLQYTVRKCTNNSCNCTDSVNQLVIRVLIEKVMKEYWQDAW